VEKKIDCWNEGKKEIARYENHHEETEMDIPDEHS